MVYLFSSYLVRLSELAGAFLNAVPHTSLPSCSCSSLNRPALSPFPFRRDVLPVLTRAGCNLGACHGNLNGKGGLKLSLKGEDAALDFATLTRDMLARPHRSDPPR